MHIIGAALTRPLSGSDNDLICARLSRSFGFHVHQARQSLGYSQEEAAHAAGIAAPAFGRIERARFTHAAWVNPTLDTLVRIHTTFDLHPYRWIRAARADMNPNGDGTNLPGDASGSLRQ